MNVLIFADIHLKTQDQFGTVEQTKLGRLNTRTAFKLSRMEQILDKEKPDVLIMAGDTFHTYNPPEIIRTLFFKLIKDVPKVFLISGNHDPKHGLPAGYSESQTNLHVQSLPVGQSYIFKPFHLVSYTRDIKKFISTCKAASEPYLVAHQDYKMPELQDLHYDTILMGHTHKHQKEGRVYSIGSLFKDTWTEEGRDNYYVRYSEENKIEFILNPDLKINTIGPLDDMPQDGELDAIRLYYKGDAQFINSIDEQLIRSKFEKTQVFFKKELTDTRIEVETEDPKILARELLKSKNLTEEEFKFGLRFL